MDNEVIGVPVSAVQDEQLLSGSAQYLNDLRIPGTLVGKLPVQFKKLGFDTHAKFDQLALDAEEFGDSDHALSQLSTLMKNCTACHAAYRFDISKERGDVALICFSREN